VDSHWTGYAELNVNLAYPTRLAWGGDYTLQEFLQNLSAHGIGVILEKGGWNWEAMNSDSIPYLVRYYSAGQYDQLGVDWDSAYAAENLYIAGETYCFFRHDPGTAIIENWHEARVLECLKDSCENPAGQFANGGRFTDSGDPSWEPRLDSYVFTYSNSAHGGRTFITRFRAAIDNSEGVANDCTVLIYDMPYLDDDDDTLSHHYVYATKGQFGGDENFEEFEIEAFADTNYRYMQHVFYTTNACDIYVDWVEYMDKEAQAAFAAIKAGKGPLRPGAEHIASR
jgi:hypothetical protein